MNSNKLQFFSPRNNFSIPSPYFFDQNNSHSKRFLYLSDIYQQPAQKKFSQKIAQLSQHQYLKNPYRFSNELSNTQENKILLNIPNKMAFFNNQRNIQENKNSIILIEDNKAKLQTNKKKILNYGKLQLPKQKNQNYFYFGEKKYFETPKSLREAYQAQEQVSNIMRKKFSEQKIRNTNHQSYLPKIAYKNQIKQEDNKNEYYNDIEKMRKILDEIEQNFNSKRN